MGQDNIQQPGLSKTVKQALLSLVFNLGGILAGLIIASSIGLFSFEPWIIALYPGVLSMRGVIGGLFSGRLSTGLHLGTVKATILGENTKKLRVLWTSIAVLTFESCVMLGFVALFFGVFLWGLNVLSGIVIFAILIATMGISWLVISPITMAVASSSFKKTLAGF